MYRFLDRSVADLAEPHRFLLAGIRLWADMARHGRCPGHALGRPFVRRGVPDTLSDFTLAMAALDRDGLTRLRLGSRTLPRVRSDEARLLVLFDAGFDAGLAGRTDRLRRIAASLVRDDAVPALTLAVGRVAGALTGSIFVERDR